MRNRPPVENGTISIHFVREALHAVQGRGLPVPEVLHHAGIPPGFIDEPLARVSPQQFGALWRELARRLQDEFFALDRHPARPGAYAMLCHALLGCQDLNHALLRLCRFSALILDGLRAHLDLDGDWAILRLDDAQPRATPFAHATYFMVAYGLACWLIDRRIPLHQCHLAGHAPGFEGEYRVMFCDDVAFGAAQGRLVFPSALLSRPVSQTPEALRAFLAQAPDVFLVKYRNTHSLGARLRAQLRSKPPQEWPELEVAATALGMTAATFRRRLGAEGATFQSIKNDLRRDMAITRLRQGGQSIEQLSHALGFTEAAAFHRAFRKWTGMRPSDYREKSPPSA